MTVVARLSTPRRNHSPLTSGAAIALLSFLGAVAAGLTILRSPGGRVAPQPAARSHEAADHARALAEDAIQRTLESPSF